MSLRFSSDAQHEKKMVEEPCLCAQMASGWVNWYRGSDRSDNTRTEIIRCSNKECVYCSGSGFEKVERNSWSPNWSYGNAVPVFKALGIPFNEIGSCSITEARRAVIRGLNVKLEQFEREPVDSVALGVYIPGLGSEDIRRRINDFSNWLEEEIKLGATKISWE